MKNLCFSVAFALVVGGALSAQSVAPRPAAPQTGPDLSGRWTREAATASADTPGFGPEVEIKQSGVDVTIQPPSGKPQRFRLDGLETAETAAVEGCKILIRVTKSQTERDRVTITTWLATTGSAACFHGQVDCDALKKQLLEIGKGPVRGPRKLESITVVSLQGDAMTVDTTRSVPGEAPVSTTTTYRK